MQIQWAKILDEDLIVSDEDKLCQSSPRHRHYRNELPPSSRSMILSLIQIAHIKINPRSKISRRSFSPRANSITTA